MTFIPIRIIHQSASSLRICGIVAGAALLLGACSSLPAPTEQVAVSKAAVADAASAGGTTFAPVEMSTAREKLDGANLAMTSEDYGRARVLAEEAQVDAQLAQTKAHSTKARKAADALLEDNRVLLEEINRKSN
jgi:Domain of unknown function (DUF4398)